MMDAKYYTQSKTVWFNLAAAVLPILAENVHLLRDYLPDGGYLLYMCLVACANVYIRSKTNTPITFKKVAPE